MVCTISSSKHTHQYEKEKPCSGCVQSTKFEREILPREQDHVTTTSVNPSKASWREGTSAARKILYTGYLLDGCAREDYNNSI